MPRTYYRKGISRKGVMQVAQWEGAGADRPVLGLPPVEGAAWGGFLRTHAVLVRRLESDLQAHHGMSMVTFEVLLHLSWAPGRRLRMSDLAARVLISTSNTTRVVDRLAVEGSVRREVGREDRRVQEAVLTELGAERLAPAHRTHIEGIGRHFLSHAEPDDLRRMARLWRRVLRDPDPDDEDARP